MKKIFIAAIRFYQRKISPSLPPCCKYFPTCSTYTAEAFEIHGITKGFILSLWRILRCNPWSKGGVDRVPTKGAWPEKPLGYQELMAEYAAEDQGKDTAKKENI